MDFKFVYKICTKVEWSEFKKKGQYTGSKKDLEDGYIHFSEEDQVQGTLKKFYSNQKDLILLKVNTLKLDGNKLLMGICFLTYILRLIYLVLLMNMK